MKIKQSTFRLICGISILVSGINSAKAVEPFENLDSNTVIAEVLGQKVYFSNIDPNTSIRQMHHATEPNEKNNLWLKQTRASELGRYFKPLWNEYVKEKGIEATEQDVNEFKERMISFLAAEKELHKKKRENLAKELIAENIETAKRAELEKSFNLYNRLIEKSPDPKLIYYPTDSNIAKQSDNMAKTFIERWKINRELYKQYKGRVIFQQAGPEPLDAYRQFLEEQQSKGKFKFYNKDAEDLFWSYWRSTGHTFCRDSNEAEQLMNTPWWLKEKEENFYETATDWGKDANGIQIRINGVRGRRIFDSNSPPAFKMDILNTSDKTFFCAALEQFCEVEVDGKWYKWNGPEAIDLSFAGFGPKKVQYDFLEIKLTENWVLKESFGEKDKKTIIPLSLGSHIIHVKFKTINTPESPEMKVVSNSLKFEIIPPRPKKNKTEDWKPKNKS